MVCSLLTSQANESKLAFLARPRPRPLPLPLPLPSPSPSPSTSLSEPLCVTAHTLEWRGSKQAVSALLLLQQRKASQQKTHRSEVEIRSSSHFFLVQR